LTRQLFIYSDISAGQLQYFANVALKFNMKLGGVKSVSLTKSNQSHNLMDYIVMHWIRGACPGSNRSQRCLWGSTLPILDLVVSKEPLLLLLSSQALKIATLNTPVAWKFRRQRRRCVILAVFYLLGSCGPDGHEFGQDDMGTFDTVFGEEQDPP